MVLAARVREVGRDVYLIVAQDAEGEGLALQDDVVCVTVASDGDRQAWGTFGGLHHPRCRHGVGLATTPGSHHVDPVGQVTQAGQYRVAVSVPVQSSPPVRTRVFYQERVYCGPCHTQEGQPREPERPMIWLGILQAVIYLLFIRAIDLYEREPLRYVIPVFIWGFAVATTVSLVFNTLFQLTLSSVTSIQTASFHRGGRGARGGGVHQGAALLLIFFISYLARRRSGLVEFAGVMDGIVYGSAVGFGFSIAEDLLYGLQFGPETYIVRRIFGGFAHASFTSLTGIGIGLIPWVDNRALKVILPVLGLSGAILLHLPSTLRPRCSGLSATWCCSALSSSTSCNFVWLAIERRAIRDELRDEVRPGR